MRALKLLGLAGATAAAVFLGSAAVGAVPAEASINPPSPAVPAPVHAPPPAAPVANTPDPGSGTAPTAAGTPCSSSARACIDLSANRAWLMQDGKVQYGPVPITHGRQGYLTPPGTFRVSFKDMNHKSSLFNSAPMPYSVFFNGGVAFHQGSLRQLSHGCVHLSRTAAKTFFNTLQTGDVVQVVP
jgi:lipoprotein-anchoring transpeptidase ErfK/SrfK